MDTPLEDNYHQPILEVLVVTVGVDMGGGSTFWSPLPGQSIGTRIGCNSLKLDGTQG
jgi:hypothetical protein